MNEQERGEALRRLLAEATSPIQPAPGGQARLLARIRARRRQGHPLRWTLAGLTTAAAVIVATVIFAGRIGGSAPSSSAASGAKQAGPDAPAVPSTSSPERAATSGSSGTRSSLPKPLPSTIFAPDYRSKDLAQQKAAGSVAEAAPRDRLPRVPAIPAPAALVPNDLDGDGHPDVLTIDRGSLVARLTRLGVQAVMLPAVGQGPAPLSVTPLDTFTGGRASVLFVRLESRPGQVRDTAVALVNGWLTVLQLDGKPVQLRVDSLHGYDCNQRELALAGQSGAFVVRGDQLVPSPKLRAVLTPAGQVSGC